MRKPPDQGNRDAIGAELGRCGWVEAGAGSGKTTELVNRLVNLVARMGVPLRNIAAITFTRKAAAELKTRVQDGIERARREERDSGRKARLDEALASMDSLFAETIHAFCMQLLRERPLEAGVPPDFDILDGRGEASLRAEVLRRGLDRLRGADKDLWEELRASGIGPRELAETFGRICDHAEVDFPPGSARKPDFNKLASDLRALLDSVEPLLGGQEDLDGKGSDLYDAYHDIRRALSMADEGGQAAVAEALTVFLKPIDVSKRPRNKAGWASTSARVAAERHFQTFQTNVGGPAVRAWQAHLYRAVMEALVPLRGETERERIRLGRLSQGDLLRLTARMLRENPEVRGQLAKTYRHLFVDEFQDTDPIQAEIMLLLAGDSDGGDWTELKPRPGSLFVVGDPKQSIYRFRRADISVFKQVKGILLEAGAAETPLQSSFRSQPPVCDWVNSVFKAVLPGDDTDVQAAFAPLDPMRPAVKGYSAGVYALDAPGGGRKAAPVAEAEADFIAKFIRGAVADKMLVEDGRGDDIVMRPVRWGDFLIIGRSRRHLAAYSRALDLLNIPNEAAATDMGGPWDGLGVFLGLLRAAADPDDELTIVACLRGPAFGVSDEDLYKFKSAGGRFRLTVEPEAEGPAARALKVLRECWKLGRDKPVGLAVEAMLEISGLAARAWEGASAQDFMAAVSYLRRRGLAGETFAGALDSLVRELSVNGGEGVGRPPLFHDPNRVRIMNLHKAKGLEGRFVFLTEPVMKCDFKPEMRIIRKGARAEGYSPVTVQTGHGRRVLAAPEGWEAHEAAEKAFGEAEKIRLQYVAATRARDFLVLTRCSEKIDNNYQAFGPLQDSLAGLPPLKIPGEVSAVEGVKSSSMRREDALRARGEALEKAARPSYELRAVTDLVEAGPAMRGPERRPEGPHGREWGTLIHKALEVLVRAGARPGLKELEALFVRVAGPGSAFAAHAGTAAELLEKVLGTDLWERVMISPERHCEVPFRIMKGTAVESGEIDLVFKVEDGWEIVDYKTDAVGEDASALAEHYKPQIAEYARQWEALTGGKVVKQLLLFVGDGRCVEVE
jgi:ATP-dependent helicase/nuclease subunit A